MPITMAFPGFTNRCLRTWAAAIALGVCAGRATAAEPSYEAQLSSQPRPSAVRFDFEASLQVEHVITPEMQAVWRKSLSEAQLAEYRRAMRAALANDLRQSGIFAKCELITGTDNSYLGIGAAPVTPELGLGKDVRGLVVANLTPKGPAAQAGLAVRDVILTIDGTPLASWEDLRVLTSRIPPGTAVKVKYLRGGAAAEVTVVLGRFEDAITSPFLIRIQSEEFVAGDCQLRITIRVVDLATRQEISGKVAQNSIGKRPVIAHRKPGRTPRSVAEAIRDTMAALKPAMTTDLQAYLEQRRLQAIDREIAGFSSAPLADLLVASDQTVAMARARNRAIIAAKTKQLPALLRDSRTDDLTALAVRLEQTVLDLNHESELAKDRAQQAVADPPASSGTLSNFFADGGASGRGHGRGQPGAGPRSGPSVEDLRDLSISYRERIELLKPIAAAIKEEIANRNR